MADDLADKSYYAHRARHARALADKARDPAVANIHRTMAEAYDRLSDPTGSTTAPAPSGFVFA